MKTKKLLALLLAGVMSASLLAGCGGNTNTPAGNEGTQDTGSASDLAHIEETGILKIGYTVYEPMNYTDTETGEFTGFDTEFSQAVCEKLGVEPEFIEIVWDTKQVSLESGEVDCLWNGMTITDSLKQNISVSDPYVQNTQVVVAKTENKDAYANYANLVGKTVAVEAGSAAQDVAEADENLSQANLVTVSKQTDALLEVKSGTADAAIFDRTMAENMIGEGTDFADLTICGVFHEEQYGIGFRKGSDLCDKVNEIMAEMKADGSLQTLADKYGLTLAE